MSFFYLVTLKPMKLELWESSANIGKSAKFFGIFVNDHDDYLYDRLNYLSKKVC